jgi:hypothetical protein
MKGLILLPLVAVIKVVLVLAGLVAVPFTSATSGLFRAGANRPHTYWERAIRNPVGGFDHLVPHPESFETEGADPIEPTKQHRRFAWRARHSGWLSSLRLVWRYNDTKYGELYIGWKLGSNPPLFDFALSLRPYATVGQ